MDSHYFTNKNCKKTAFQLTVMVVKKYFRKVNLIFIFARFKENRDVAQPGSVLAWGARGRWFESSHPDKKRSNLLLFEFIQFSIFLL